MFLQKMQLNKKIALTKANEDKAAALKKQNDELGYMFLPTQVSVEILQGKDPRGMSTKVERAALLMVEIHGVAEFCAKAKPPEVINFYNNVESVWDHVVKLNKCFKLDRKTEYFVTAGSADKHDQPIEAIANCALDMMDAGHRGLMRPDAGKPVKISLAIGSGMTVTAVSTGSIPKFGIYGVSITHAGLMIAQAQEEQILLGPTTRSLLPAMYKVKDYKEIAGVGLAHQLLDREGRKPLSDKDIHSLAPVKQGDSKDDGKDKAGKGDAAVAAGTAGSGGAAPTTAAADRDTEAP